MKLFSWQRTTARFAPVMVLAILFYLTGCASSSDVATEGTTLKTPSAVPGEKSSEEPVGAAPAGPGSAGVKW